MSQTKKIKINSRKFSKFLDDLSKINDLGVLSFDDKIYSLLSNSESSLYLVGTYYVEDLSEIDDLNCPSLKKLQSLISHTKSNEIELHIQNNSISYKSDGIKFKYHLYDDGIISKPKITLSKLENFEYDVEFDVSKEFISSVLKSSSNVVTSKIYFRTDDNSLLCEIKDDEVANSDVLSFTMEDDVDFDLSFIFPLNNLRLMQFSDTCKFRFNTKIGLCSVISAFDDYRLEYVSPSLMK